MGFKTELNDLLLKYGYMDFKDSLDLKVINIPKTEKVIFLEVGSNDWEPTSKDLKNIVEMILKAFEDRKEILSVVAVRKGVNLTIQDEYKLFTVYTRDSKEIKVVTTTYREAENTAKEKYPGIVIDRVSVQDVILNFNNKGEIDD